MVVVVVVVVAVNGSHFLKLCFIDAVVNVVVIHVVMLLKLMFLILLLYVVVVFEVVLVKLLLLFNMFEIFVFWCCCCYSHWLKNLILKKKKCSISNSLTLVIYMLKRISLLIPTSMWRHFWAFPMVIWMILGIQMLIFTHQDFICSLHFYCRLSNYIRNISTYA